MSLFFQITTSHAISLCYHLYGQTTCGMGEVQTLNAAGIVHLKKTIVNRFAMVQGDLFAQNSTLPLTTIQGNAALKNTIVKGKILVIGDLKCLHCILHDDLTLISNHALLQNSELNNILVKDSHEYQQTLTFQGKSVVNGNIQFLSKNGKIKYCSQTQFKGKITGGTLQQIPCTKSF